MKSDSFPKRAGLFLLKYEPWIFGALVLLNTIPLLTSKFFVTVDGPSHIYNASLIKELIFGNDPAVHAAFAINPEPIPNWTAHFLLTFFRLFMPSWLAEKSFLLFYVIGLPYSFRFMIGQAEAKRKYAALLVIPFTFTYLLLMGFFNFVVAFLPLFFLLGIYFKTGTNFNRRKTMIVFAWLTILYFSHIYVFIAGAAIIGLHGLTLLSEKKEKRWKSFFRFCRTLFLLLLPFMILFFIFMSRHPSYSGPDDLDLNTRLGMIRKMTCFALYSLDTYSSYYTTIGAALLLLLITGIISRISKSRKKIIPFFTTGDCWLIAGIIFFILFLFVPDQAGGGMNCFRLQHLSLICFTAWIALNAPRPVITLPVLVLVLLIQARLISFYIPMNAGNSEEAEEWSAAGMIPEKNSITTPILFNRSWMDNHIDEYFGAANTKMLAGNYEAGLNWFPVVFNHSMYIMLEGQQDMNPLNEYLVYGRDSVAERKIADYVVIWKKPYYHQDSVLYRPIDSLLSLNYKICYHSNNIQLFKRNNH